jgi:hypothetical protein
MKKVWKWIIGIVLGLIVLAVLVGVGFLVRGNFHIYRAETLGSRNFSQRGPELFGRGQGIIPYGGFEHMRGPGMMGYGMMPFGGFFGGLISLGFLALVVLGIIWLVRRLRTPKPVDVPSAAPAAIPADIVNPCKKCGMPLHDGWKICPYCGKKV